MDYHGNMGANFGHHLSAGIRCALGRNQASSVSQADLPGVRSILLVLSVEYPCM